MKMPKDLTNFQFYSDKFFYIRSSFNQTETNQCSASKWGGTFGWYVKFITTLFSGSLTDSGFWIESSLNPAHVTVCNSKDH